MIEGLILVVKGFLLGLAIAAPVGPIGLLCIRRTLEYGPGVGFATGMGAAVADTIFGAIAAFGMTAVVAFLTGHEALFRIFGGVFLLGVAYKTYYARPALPKTGGLTRDWLSGFTVGLTLTLTNPITILACLALFAGVGLSGTLGRSDASLLVLGVFIGSAAWWLTLSSGVSLVRTRMSEDRLVLINRGTAMALAVFGLWALGSVVNDASTVVMAYYWPSAG